MSDRLNPDDALENSAEDDTAFPCACGDETCIGHNDDKDNIRIGRAWYAADCVMANHHPLVVECREREARDNEARDK